MVSTRSQRSSGENHAADTAATSTQPRATSRSKKQQQQAPSAISEADEDIDQTAKAAGADQAESDSPFKEREIKLLSPRSGGRSIASPPKTIQAADLAALPLPEDEEDGHAKDVPPPASDQKKQRRAASGRTASSSSSPSSGPFRRSLASWLATCMVVLTAALLFSMHRPSLTQHLPPQLLSATYPACTAVRAQLQQARVQLDRALAQAQPTALHLQAQASHLYSTVASSIQRQAGLAGVDLASLAAQASALMDQAKAQAAELLARLTSKPQPLPSTPSPPLGSPFSAWALLEGLIAPNDHHDSETFAATAARSQQQHKALALLLSCPSDAACAATADRIASLPNSPVPAGCVALLSSADFSDAGSEAAGRLQHRLASLLLRCLRAASPAVVVFRGLEQVQPSVLAVLNNALSESGNLQLDGAAVPTSSAVFIFPVPLTAPASGQDGQEMAAGATELGEEAEPGSYEALARRAKDSLQGHLLRAAALADREAGVEQSEGSVDAVAGLVRALRRRLDLVLPVVGSEEVASPPVEEVPSQEAGEM
jgi:hypothetical protein